MRIAFLVLTSKQLKESIFMQSTKSRSFNLKLFRFFTQIVYFFTNSTFTRQIVNYWDNLTLKLRNQNNIKSIQQILTREDIFYFQCPPSISQFVIVEELVLFGEKLFWHLHVWSFNIDKYLKKFSFYISIDICLDPASKKVNKNKEFLKKKK